MSPKGRGNLNVFTTNPYLVIYHCKCLITRKIIILKISIYSISGRYGGPSNFIDCLKLEGKVQSVRHTGKKVLLNIYLMCLSDSIILVIDQFYYYNLILVPINSFHQFATRILQQMLSTTLPFHLGGTYLKDIGIQVSRFYPRQMYGPPPSQELSLLGLPRIQVSSN